MDDAPRFYDEWKRHEPVTVPSPALGAGFTFSPAQTNVTVLRTLSFVLVNAAAAASRIPRVEYLNSSGAVIFSVAAPFHTTTGVTSRFSFGIGVYPFGAIDAATIGGPLPDLEIKNGLSVRVVVAAINAGDQISAISAMVDQSPYRPDEVPH